MKKVKFENVNGNIVLLENNMIFYNTDDALSYAYNQIGHYAPLSVYFELTNCCNFKCPFCYINYSDENKESLDTIELKKHIDFLCNHGMICATLSGGECLLHSDFKEIYTYLHNRNILITVLTNGSLINEDIINLFIEKKPYKVEVSLYASNENTMKINTKQTHFTLEQVKNNVINLKDHKINVICKTPVNNVTSSSFFEIYDWCRSNEIPFYYSDELFNKYDGSCNNEYLLDNREIQTLIDNDKYLLYRKMNWDLTKTKKCFDCKAGKYSMVLSYDNYIYPCFEFRQIHNGIFKIDGKIDVAYKKLETYISTLKGYDLTYCKGCNAYSICQDCVINQINSIHNCNKYRKERKVIMKNISLENEELIKKYDTITLNTERLILKKGTSNDCKKIYEYDMLKCRGIGGEEVLEKVKQPVDFIGNNSKDYYKNCAINKMFDWYVYLKDGTPIANITADREIKDLNSIELSFNMHPDYWRKGYMKESVTAVINYLFNIGYSNIIIGYDTGNTKSEKFAKNLGFEEYRTLKNTYQKNGIDIDTKLMIMPKEKWEQYQNEMV